MSFPYITFVYGAAFSQHDDGMTPFLWDKMQDALERGIFQRTYAGNMDSPLYVGVELCSISALDGAWVPVESDSLCIDDLIEDQLKTVLSELRETCGEDLYSFVSTCIDTVAIWSY